MGEDMRIVRYKGGLGNLEPAWVSIRTFLCQDILNWIKYSIMCS